MKIYLVNDLASAQLLKVDWKKALNRKEVFALLLDLQNALFDMDNLKRDTKMDWFLIIE